MQVGAVLRTTVIHTKKRIINESERTGTCYSYDAIGNLTNVLPATYSVLDESYQAITNAESVSYSYNAQNRLDEIATESTVYPFSYDVYDKLDNLKEVWYNYANDKLGPIYIVDHFVRDMFPYFLYGNTREDCFISFTFVA